MPRRKVFYEVCDRIQPVPTRIFSLLLVLLQGALLDAFLFLHYGGNWYWWFVADLGTATVFIAAFVVAGKYYKRTKHNKMEPESHLIQGRVLGLLPLGYIAWFTYSGLMVPRVALIFKHIAAGLDEKDILGPNFLKTALALTAPIFLLMVLSQHNKKQTQERKHYIETLVNVVPFDILDSVEFLEILFVQESRLVLPFTLEDFIIAFPCINLIIPGFCFVVLSQSFYGERPLSRGFQFIYTLSHILLVNVPFLTIRMYLWHLLSQDISVFLIKNIMMICLGVNDLYELCGESDDDGVDGAGADGEPGEAMELQDRPPSRVVPIEDGEHGDDEEQPHTVFI
ncbi:transmembrane protein 121B-like [Lingula anatina]|uniref:Transmembrane protein 121B-like n=1 Tax=Lingula anatina TaxID=7574 RepID=A0A1S3H861_LINAN|nr:transmembrane protein 121B-like [Lingula anatina]XP_013382305.1 transmembrane protein 121B-like [Lingula anatina]XP_013382313.1 transmembrane protein 121B-like [Lingula anatina]|eukprot:XP_013382297.1 transmembrane protein 121B-like [Lingula anatina]